MLKILIRTFLFLSSILECFMYYWDYSVFWQLVEFCHETSTSGTLCLSNFLDQVSLGSLGWPEIHNLDQTGFELIETSLPLPTEC